ncbi:hypothetical protein ACFXTO_013949 [Malus domestica]
MNHFLLLKRCWDVVSSDSPASIFLRSRFLAKDFSIASSYKKSLVWLGLKKIFPDLLPQLQWLIGDGSQTRFWTDNWLGEPIVHSLGIHHHVASALKAKVCDFIGPNGWVLPTNFSSSFSVIAETITSTSISLEAGVDKLIWTSSSSGLMIAKDAFSYLNGHNSQLVWGKAIWDSSIQPRKSITTWKALHRRLLTDDYLQRHGVALVSVCCFHLNVAQTVSHLFLECPFIQEIWNWLSLIFNRPYVQCGSLENLFSSSFFAALSSSSRRLWVLVVCNATWSIWSLRNKIRFEGAKLGMAHAKARILTCSKESASLVFSSVPSTSNAHIFQTLSVSPLLSTAPRFIPVVWKSHKVGWIKVNVDGSFKSTGSVGYGGVFQNS